MKKLCHFLAELAEQKRGTARLILRSLLYAAVMI